MNKLHIFFSATRKTNHLVVHNNHNAKNLVASSCYQGLQFLHLLFALLNNFHTPYAIATGNMELQGSMNSTLGVCVYVCCLSVLN